MVSENFFIMLEFSFVLLSHTVLLLHVFILIFFFVLYSRLQIVSFLQQNAHPHVVENTPTIPENVTDQVWLETLCTNIAVLTLFWY
jgi:hypothetical protein